MTTPLMEAFETQQRLLRKVRSEVAADFENDAFLEVAEGRGGTFAFGKKSDNIGDATHYIEQGPARIGTIWCTTCVGLFVQVDKKRCFMAHIHGWTNIEDNCLVDEAGGNEIRTAVLRRLRYEYERRGWDRRNDNFAQLVVLCSPKTIPRSLHEEIIWKNNTARTGSFVFLGVGDFLREQVFGLMEDARRARDRAKELTGQESLHAKGLRKHIEQALRAETDPRLIGNLQEAAASIDECIELTQKAEKLSQTTESMIVREAHGIIVDQTADQAVLVKEIAWNTKEGDLWRCRQRKPPTDIDHFIPVPAALRETENWAFCRQLEIDNLWDFFQARAEILIRKRKSGTMEAVLSHAEPEGTRRSSEEVRRGRRLTEDIHTHRSPSEGRRVTPRAPDRQRTPSSGGVPLGERLGGKSNRAADRQSAQTASVSDAMKRLNLDHDGSEQPERPSKTYKGKAKSVSKAVITS